MSSLSKIALGTAQFGLKYGIANRTGQVSKPDIARIIARSREAGFDTVDTAVSYGDAECRLGEAGVATWKVVTKLPPIPDTLPVVSWVQSMVNDSIARLKIKRLYALMLHQPVALLRPGADNLYGAMIRAKQLGLVEKIGISAYDPEQIEKVVSCFPIDIVQAPFNIIDRRMRDSGCLAMLKQRQIEFHARSIFLQGLILLDANHRPHQFVQWAKIWSSWHAWLTERQLSPLAACIGFVAADAGVERMVVGVDNLAQLDQIIRVADRPVRLAFPSEFSSDDPGLINPSNWCLS